MNMCSKCYRDHVLKQTNEATVKSTLQEASNPPVSSADVVRSAQHDEGLILPSSSPGSSVASIPSIATKDNVSMEIDEADPSPASTAPIVVPAPAPSAPASNRCASCKRRVGLTGFRCRCNSVFCSLHRYADKHDCSFDYKAAGREAIAKANPVVKAEKIEKI